MTDITPWRETQTWLYCTACGDRIAAVVEPESALLDALFICHSCTGHHPRISTTQHPNLTLADYMELLHANYPDILPHYAALADKTRQRLIYYPDTPVRNVPDLDLDFEL